MNDPETILLQLALKNDFVSQEDLQRVASLDSSGNAETIHWRRYGPKIDSLISLGLLTEDQVEDLKHQLDGDETHPGWMMASPELSKFSSNRSDQKRSRTFPIRDWDRFQDVEYLAEGGMATVFRAMDPRLKRAVALKLILNPDRQGLDRFLQEARSQARIDHPHVCRIYEVGEVQGLPYIAMQLLDALPIDELRDQMSREQKVMAIRDVAEAVHAAHRMGLIHRDLKPANILVENREEGWWPIVVDFGLAGEVEKHDLTMAGTLMGTPSYMAPEQARGEVDKVDRRTDVYALGATLYTLMLGQPPFKCASAIETAMKVIQETAPRPRSLDLDLPEDLETIILTCLEKEPHRRYDSAKLLAEDLQRYLDGDPLHAKPLGWKDYLLRWIRHNRAMSMVLAGSTVAILLTTALAVRVQWRARTRAQLAQRFGLESERLESSLRRAQMLPVHDLRPQKTELRNWLASLEAKMKSLGPAAQGPGHFALGKGHLALCENAEALDHLERAWRAGNRTSENAEAIGQAHAALLGQAMEESSRLNSPEARKIRMTELDQQHRWPALYYLGLSGNQQESLGNLAFLGRHYDEALQQARRAIARDPWLVEARLLEAKAQLALADQLIDQGAFEAAARRAAEALVATQAAQDIARSLPESYILEADARLKTMYLLIQQGKPFEEEAKAIEKPLGLALRIDPGSTDSHIRNAILFRRWADADIDRGQNPMELLEKAALHAQTATQSDPSNPHAPYLVSQTYRFMAEYLESRGQDPLPRLKQALEAGNRAVKMRPGDYVAHTNLGNILLTRAEHLQLLEQDARQDLKAALHSYAESAQLNPRSSSPLINTGICFRRLAMQDLDEGKDPIPNMDLAVSAYEAAIKLNPRHISALNNLGTLFRYKADVEIMQRKDPRPSIEKGRLLLKQALEVNPTFAISHGGLGELCMLEGNYLALQGEPSMDRFQEALAHHNQALLHNPNSATRYQTLGETHLAMARVLLDQRKSAGTALKSAEDAFQNALKINPNSVDNLLNLGHAWLLKERPGSLSDRGARKALELGQKARVVRPWAKEPLLFMAEVHLRQAESMPTAKRGPSLESARKLLDEHERLASFSPQREALLGCAFLFEGKPREARKSLESALAKDARLKSRFGNSLAESTRKSGSK